MRRPIPKGLFFLSPVLVTGSLVKGATVYDSAGFEASRFTTTFTNNSIVGNLRGQDSGVSIWKESTTDPSGVTDIDAGTAVVQASGGGANLRAQDVLVTRTQYDDRWAPSFSVTPTTLNLITISWDMLVNQSTGSTSNFGPFFGIEANDSTSGDKQIGALGVDATTGELLVYDKSVGGLNITPNDVGVTLGQFNHFVLTLNYSTDTYAVALNGVTEESGLSFFTSGATHFTDADIAALQAAPTAEANQAGSAVFDNYLITNTTGALPIVIYTGNTLSAGSDSGIGTSGAPVEFAGGTLSTTATFSTTRSFTVDPLGGTITAASGTTLGLNSTVITWTGSTLTTTGPGKISFALSGAASVAPGSTLNILADSVIVGGTADPFTDSSTPTQHVAIVDNGGSLAVNINSTVAGITGNGQLIVGTGSTTNTLHLAASTGGSSVTSLTINTGAKFDLANNHLFINYGTGADPRATIISYLHSGYNGGTWNGSGIDSSTAAANSHYGVGFVDFSDNVIDTSVTTGQIEIAYTLYGDINLDGVVNATDLSLFAANFNKVDSGWDEGDFNYDGLVNASDFSLFGLNFGKSASGTSVDLPSNDWAALDAFAASQGFGADVPEPASAGILLLAASGMLMRRRRSRRIP